MGLTISSSERTPGCRTRKVRHKPPLSIHRWVQRNEDRYLLNIRQLVGGLYVSFVITPTGESRASPESGVNRTYNNESERSGFHAGVKRRVKRVLRLPAVCPVDAGYWNECAKARDHLCPLCRHSEPDGL